MRFSQVMMLAGDFSSTRPVPRIPTPSLLTFIARAKSLCVAFVTGAVRNLNIGVPLRSLNRRPHSLQR
jgi:hypothetical protein